MSLFSRWAHIGTAIVLTGGLTALRFVVFPVLKDHPDLVVAIRNRWRRLVHSGIALILLSGGYNYYRAMPLHKGDGVYHALVGTKMLLALVIFYIASAMVGKSAGTQKFRENSARWALITLMLAAIVIAMSGFAKVRSSATAAPAATTEAVPE